MSPDDLIAFILQLQSAHAQQVADLEAHCAEITRQLNDFNSSLNSSLNSYIDSQTTAMHSLKRKIVSKAPILPSFRPSARNNTITPEQPVVESLHSVQSTPVQSTPVQSTPNPTSATTTATATATAPQSPAPIGQARKEIRELKVTPAATPDEPPVVEASYHNNVRDAWEEYRYGRNGNPSVESLNAAWGPRWRTHNSSIQMWYSRRKVIYDKVKELMADGLDEMAAVNEVEAMRRDKSMNWLGRFLQEDRKRTRRTWREAAKAATAAKEARTAGGHPSGGYPNEGYSNGGYPTGGYPPGTTGTTGGHPTGSHPTGSV